MAIDCSLTLYFSLSLWGTCLKFAKADKKMKKILNIITFEERKVSAMDIYGTLHATH